MASPHVSPAAKHEHIYNLNPRDDLLLSFEGEEYFARGRTQSPRRAHSHFSTSRLSTSTSSARPHFQWTFLNDNAKSAHETPQDSKLMVHDVTNNTSNNDPELVQDETSSHASTTPPPAATTTARAATFDASNSMLHNAEWCGFWYAVFEFLRLEVFSNYDVIFSLAIYAWIGIWLVSAWVEARMSR